MDKALIISKIKSEAWDKNWSGNWRAAFASLYHLYTTDLRPYIGKNLKVNLLICEKDVSSNFVSKKDLDNYCQYLAKSVIKNNNLLLKWSEDTITTAGVIFKLLKKLKNSKNLTANNLLALKSGFYLHIPPHFSMKKVIDYLPPKLQKKFSPKLIDARIKTENLFNAIDSALRAYCKKISWETGYPISLTEFLIIDEIITYLTNKKIPNKKELTDRSKGLAIFCEGNNLNLLANTDYENLQKNLIGLTGDKLRGAAAYRGFAKGVARVVFDPFKVKRFEEGDILITGMTRPEFLPLMKKAAAFVTDAGGLLSHAAIIARELKKPCLLATKVASEIIKDGDLVEVDANKGIVKILKRA
ncbi:MAG: PEP-utilizing enzyme [Patescibacteria group bacterium]|nr:PEP-utilizing enzyme [Patescibacteria group bacterium]MDD5294833.1 PEP-utilizing enzyme [Patescibacteria group bacterium]MDD5554737.1 PEP-utilizing enzyme [Patescibacteria group bacterium]